MYNYPMQQTRQVSGHVYPYKRILAVKLADLGDLLSVTPALQALRAAHPQAQIDLLAQPSSARILEGAPYLDNILTFDGTAYINPLAVLQPPKLARVVRFLLKLRLARYDALAVFHHSTLRWGVLQRTMLTFAAAAPVTAGLDNGLPYARIFASRLTHRVPDLGFGAQHEASYWLAVAATLGADANAGWRTHIPVNDEHRRLAAQLLTEVSTSDHHPLVAIHPGAGAYSRARIWPVDRFAAVARRLIQEHNAHILVIGGPDETEAANQMVDLVTKHEEHDTTSAIRNLVGRTSIHQTAALIERCDLFVGGDSGPMHVSVAVGTPVVAIFGPSNKDAWGPYTPPTVANPHTVIARNLPCQPCFYRAHSLGLREGCGTRPCLLGLGIESVMSACAARLG